MRTPPVSTEGSTLRSGAPGYPRAGLGRGHVRGVGADERSHGDDRVRRTTRCRSPTSVRYVRGGSKVTEGEVLAEPGPTGETEHAVPVRPSRCPRRFRRDVRRPALAPSASGASHPPPAPEAPPAQPPVAESDPATPTATSPQAPAAAPASAPPPSPAGSTSEPAPGSIRPVDAGQRATTAAGIAIGSISKASVPRPVRPLRRSGSASPARGVSTSESSDARRAHLSRRSGARTRHGVRHVAKRRRRGHGSPRVTAVAAAATFRSRPTTFLRDRPDRCRHVREHDRAMERMGPRCW